MTQEGVTRFSYDLTAGSAATEHDARELQRWRQELFVRDAIGCDLQRYGACYGNMSVRTGSWAAAPGRREFLVSCTQTGGDIEPGTDALVRVTAYDHSRNFVRAVGPCPPSSETLTHGAIYDADLEVRAVVHGHDAHTWRWLLVMDAPQTPDHVDYGTLEMAAAAKKLVRSARQRPWRLPGVFAMAGHQDGVVAWGSSVAEATQRFLDAYHRARLR